jgi:hypothetical protein
MLGRDRFLNSKATLSFQSSAQVEKLLITATAPKPITLEEFLKLPETKPAFECIDGQIIQKPMPKGRHSSLQSELCTNITLLAIYFTI